LISRFYLKEFLTFNEVDIRIQKGLIVFTGPSGAGKSVLMDAFLSLFAKKEPKAKLSEIVIEEHGVCDEAYCLEIEDDIVLKQTKKDKVRFFLNNQSISKKNLQEFSNSLVKHLHLKDTSDFQSSQIIEFLDFIASRTNNEFLKIKENFSSSFYELKEIKRRIDKIKEDEKKIDELKEFVSYEIEKIASIDPKVGEYEELNEIKKKLSKKDKIEEAIEKASLIFTVSNNVSHALNLLEVDISFFDDTINELNNIFEKFNDSLYELEDVDIEETLDKIEKLSSLQKRFGSIEAALEYKDKKEQELEKYENITFEKAILEKKEKKLSQEVTNLAKKLTLFRQESIKILEEKINYYLRYLYLSNANLILKDKTIDTIGKDEAVFELNGVNLDTISSGEFNRLRLALLASKSELEMSDNGILFLDEIDANLSGKESESIAKVLAQLSLSYQIFAISHQPQLTSIAAQHFLVEKNNGVSTVRELNSKERVEEISRMISGENVTAEALKFAQGLITPNK